MLDGNMIALDRYERDYAQSSWESEIASEAEEAEILGEIGGMMENEEYEGKECFICGATIHGKGFINASHLRGSSDTTYYFYCADCEPKQLIEFYNF